MKIAIGLNLFKVHGAEVISLSNPFQNICIKKIQNYIQLN